MHTTSSLSYMVLKRVSTFPLPTWFYRAWENFILLRSIDLSSFPVLSSKDFESDFQPTAGQVRRATGSLRLPAKPTASGQLGMSSFLHLDPLFQTFQPSAMLSRAHPLCNLLPLVIRKRNNTCQIQNSLEKHKSLFLPEKKCYCRFHVDGLSPSTLGNLNLM